MRKVLLWIGVVGIAALLGVGAAAGSAAVARLIGPRIAARLGVVLPEPTEEALDEWMPGWQEWGDGMRGGPMMGPNGRVFPKSAGERISLDRAVEIARDYAASYGADLKVAEVMEFSDNFYAAITETESGRGAFEILIDPYRGDVYPEPGPNMMWNRKYGHMGRGETVEHTVSLEEARRLGQAVLDENGGGAQLAEDGIEFYGYYTFDYKVGGQPAGMLSVNALSGRVWLHTWHGTFISEMELEK